jgi:uncharacterized protein YqgQ
MEPKNAAIVIGIASAICAVGWFVARSNAENKLNSDALSEKLAQKRKSRSASVSEEENEVSVSDVLEQEDRLQKVREGNKQVLALYKLFEEACRNCEESENPDDLLDAEKIGLEVLGVCESFFGKSSLYGIICSELSEVYQRIGDTLTQKELLLEAEEILAKEVDKEATAYFKVVNKLFMQCQSTTEYEEATAWSLLAAQTMEKIYLKSKTNVDLLSYAISYFNYSYYNFYVGKFPESSKWWFFSRDIMSKYFLFSPQTFSCLKSKTQQLFLNSEMDAVLTELCHFVALLEKSFSSRSHVASFESENHVNDEKHVTTEERKLTPSNFYLKLAKIDISVNPLEKIETYSNLISLTANYLFANEQYLDCQKSLEQLLIFNENYSVQNHQTNIDLISVYWHQKKVEEAENLENFIIKNNVPFLGYSTSNYLKTTTSILYRDMYILQCTVNKKKRKQLPGELYNPSLFLVDKFYLVASFQNPFGDNYFEVAQTVVSSDLGISIDYKLSQSIESNLYYRCIIYIYSDDSRSLLLGTHRQLIFGAFK